MAHKVETPVGNLYVIPQGKTDGAHTLYVQFGKRRQYHEEIPEDDPGVILRGVEHYGSFHAYQWSNGLYGCGHEWLTDGNYKVIEPRRPSSTWEHRKNLYMSRAQFHGLSNSATDKAKDFFLSHVLGPLSQWANENPRLLALAEIYRLRAKLGGLETKALEAAKALDAAMDAVSIGKNQLAAAVEAAERLV